MAYIELGEVCDVVKGEIGITKAVPGKYPMVTTGADRISHNVYQLDTEAVLVPLVSATGHGHASIKRIHYQDGKFAFGSILAACVPKDKRYSAQFLHIYFQLMKDHVLVPLMKGSANVSLTLGNLKTARVPDLSRELQESIVELYTTLKVEQDKAIETMSVQRSDIVSIRQAILQEAIQGKLTVKWRSSNPSVEDASELLKRIEAEKQLLIAGKKIKKEQPLPPIVDEEKPYELPEGWVWCRLGELALYQKGYAFKSANYKEKGIMITKIKNLNDGHTDNSVYIDSKRIKEFEQYILWEKDIVMTTVGSWFSAPASAVGRSFIVNYIFHNSLLNQNAVRIRFWETLEPMYFHSCINAPTYKNYLVQEAQGTANQASITQASIKSFLVSVPPQMEQKAIVEKVNSLMALCDELEQQIDNSQTQIEQLMQSCLKEVFED
jgi:type I restriction enzyme, S subunit